MRHLIEGVTVFQRDHFEPNKEAFRKLAGGQSPTALFVTCSDSRIDPNLLTQTPPGELFVLRNAGNVVPAHGTVPGGGEEATIEYAMLGLGVEEIVVMGHSGCGAMEALLKREHLEGLPAVSSWLGHAEEARRAVEAGASYDGEKLADAVIEANVLLQLDNLLTHPSVAKRHAAGEVRLHGWVYGIGDGLVRAHDADQECFVSLTEDHAAR